MDLNYRAHKPDLEELALNECELRPTRSGDGPTYWMLWFYVARETDGVPDAFAVEVNPGGGYKEQGVGGGHCWGLLRAGNVWEVSPSINVLNTGDGKAFHPGAHPTLPSLWHQTPRVVGVPDGESWQ